MTDALMLPNIPIGHPVVYFLQPVDGGPVKIGTTKHLRTRQMALEVDFRKKLVILKIIPGSFPVERFVHRQFSHLRFKGTEQFKPGLDLMAFIGHPDRADESVAEPMRVHWPFYMETRGYLASDREALRVWKKANKAEKRKKKAST